jgi:hypothetical protein
MTVRTVINLPAATHVETVRCLFAIELSKQSWVIGFIARLSTRISRRTLIGSKWKALLELIEEVRGQARDGSVHDESAASAPRSLELASSHHAEQSEKR